MTKILKCFRCGKPIEDELFVHTLSNEYAHIYCQATGVKPLPDKPKVRNRKEELCYIQPLTNYMKTEPA